MRSLKITGSSRLATICVRAGLIAGLAASLAACNTTTATDTTGGIPDDYRARHPISLQEGKKTLVLFVGHGRGSLLPTQRAEVLAFARNWQRDATGGVTIDRPMGGATERAANDSLRETMSIIVQAGVPNNGIVIRTFDAAGQKSSWLRLHYPLMVAHAGPCGLWPDDVGADYNVKHFQNKEYYNFGSATSPPWSPIRPTWCSRARKRLRTKASAAIKWTSGARVRTRQPPTPMPRRARSAISANDQIRIANSTG
jgi:pilus assembly protein CpaD